jgi:hypothetical protein
LCKSLPSKEKQLATSKCGELSLIYIRGDKTPLELFLAGLRGLDAEVRQRIGLQEQSA